MSPSRKVVLSSSPKKWHVEIDSESLDLSNIKVNWDETTGRLFLSGKVQCTYRKTEYYSWNETFYWQHYGAWNIPYKSKVMHRTFKSDKKSSRLSYQPESLWLFGPENAIVVHPDKQGNFQGTFWLKPVSRPRQRKYFKLHSKWDRRPPVRVMLAAEEQRRLGISFPAASIDIPAVKHYSLIVDKKSVRDFVDSHINSHIFPITISARDQVTRMLVSPNIVVECIYSPNVKDMLREEFTDSETLTYALKCVDRFLQKGQSTKTRGQVISFPAYAGARYRIRSYDPNYHHLQVVITADQKNPRKSILLVEKGTKIRVDNTKEGVGDIIDE